MEDADLTSITTEMPCCGQNACLMDIEFDWPAGFARFELSVMNPNVKDNLTKAQSYNLKNTRLSTKTKYEPTIEKAGRTVRSTEVANRPVPDGKPTGRDIGDRGRYLLQKNPFRIDMTTVADEFDPPRNSSNHCWRQGAAETCIV